MIDQQSEAPELSNDELRDAAAAIGLTPVQAFIRKPKSKGAERQARYREKQKQQGKAEVRLTADEKLADALKAVQANVASGKPVHVALIEQARKAKPQVEGEAVPAVNWRKKAEELQARIDAFNALPWWSRIWRRV